MDFKFKKSLGQNFLTDKNILNKIVTTSNIEKKSLVIEVGPGSGNLTLEIAKIANQVLCYEIDTRLEPILKENLNNFSNVNIIYDDFLKRNIQNDIQEYDYDNLYLIANLPYYITTPIIEKIIDSNLPFKQITIMVQKEVGDRFTSLPKSKSYGSLTVYLNYYFDIKKEFTVSRNAFIPKPNVDSVIVTLKKKEKLPYLKDIVIFNKLLKECFKFKRKTLKNNLSNYNLEIIENILKANGYSLNNRAEEIPADIFIEIANNIS